MTALSMLLSLLAFALFGLATDAHHRRRLGGAPGVTRARRMRVLAWVALVAAFPPAIAAQGWVFGPILWFAGVMLGAGIVFLALNFLPLRQK